jgi:membrane-associated phospholipid phosphatase
MKVATSQTASRPGTLWPIDKLFIAYAAIMIRLLFMARHEPVALWLILGHIAAISLLVVFSRNTSAIAEFAHHWFLLVYVPFCYKQVPFLVSVLNLRPADDTLAHWDLAMWKVDPVFWLSSAPNRFLVEFFQAIYSMFIPGIIVLGIILWTRRPRPEFRYGTFAIAATFLISYIGYLLLPARGPRFMAYASQYAQLHGLWTFNFFQSSLNTLEGLQYDCFPSGHVAAVLVGCFLARRVSAPVFYAFSAFAACIAFSTVYLRYHYVIDVIAGMLLAIIVIIFSPMVYRKLEAGHPVMAVPSP